MQKMVPELRRKVTTFCLISTWFFVVLTRHEGLDLPVPGGQSSACRNFQIAAHAHIIWFVGLPSEITG
jgi:hypothetical protein